VIQYGVHFDPPEGDESRRKPGVRATGRGFESISLQGRVACEPEWHRGQRQALLGGAAPGRARLPFKKADAVGAQGAAQVSALPRSRVRIGRGRLPAAAHEPSGFGTGVLAALEDRGAGDQGRLVALGSLYEALAAGGEVINDLGRVQA
jgi:hypothetical protein